MKTPFITLMRVRLLPLMLAMICGFSLTARGATQNPPDMMSYQGYLTDNNGVALGAPDPLNYDISFRIYAGPSGGNAIWGEKHTVTVDNGYFSVMLGSAGAVNTPTPVAPRPALSTIFSGTDASDRYIEMTVNTGSATFTVLPRLQLLPSSYSFLSSKARVLEATGASRLNNLPLYFSNGTSTNVGLQYSTLFGTAISLDGPSLFGNVNGVLGTVTPSTKVALRWDDGKVAIGKDTAATSTLDVNGTVTATSFVGSLSASSISGGTLPTSVIPDLSAAKITSGSFPDSVLSANVAVRNAPNNFVGNQVITGGKMSVGIGGTPTIPFQVDGGLSASLSSNSGDMVIGTITSGNMVFDQNTIQARNNGAAATLEINSNGGMVSIGGATGTAPTLFLEGNNLSSVGWTVSIYNSSAPAQYRGGIRLGNAGYLELSNEAILSTASYARLDSNGSWSAVSDRRRKKDISTLGGLLDGALALRPVQFHFLKDSSEAPLQIGFIAQEVQEKFPSLVTDDGNVLTLNYSGLGVVAIGAIQDLAKQVEAKSEAIDKLENEVAALKKTLAQFQDQEKRISKLEELETTVRSLATKIAAK